MSGTSATERLSTRYNFTRKYPVSWSRALYGGSRYNMDHNGGNLFCFYQFKCQNIFSLFLIVFKATEGFV